MQATAAQATEAQATQATEAPTTQATEAPTTQAQATQEPEGQATQATEAQAIETQAIETQATETQAMRAEPMDPKLAALKAFAEAFAAAKGLSVTTAAGAGEGGATSSTATADALNARPQTTESGRDAMEVGQSEIKAAESELVHHVVTDPMAAYDIDVTEEGDIIATFLTLLSTAPEESFVARTGSSGSGDPIA